MFIATRQYQQLYVNEGIELFLYAVTIILLALVNYLYVFISWYCLKKSSGFFHWNLSLLIGLIVSTICNQLVSILGIKYASLNHAS